MPKRTLLLAVALVMLLASAGCTRGMAKGVAAAVLIGAAVVDIAATASHNEHCRRDHRRHCCAEYDRDCGHHCH